MSLFVDTSVWSLALRRDAPPDIPQVLRLKTALEQGTEIISTGLVLQELLQGISGPKSKQALLQRFGSIPFVSPDREDHIAAAELRNACRRSGIQVGTIDALLAQLCLRYKLAMLTTDLDFPNMRKIVDIKLA